jgi:hypothetical protein
VVGAAEVEFDKDAVAASAAEAIAATGLTVSGALVVGTGFVDEVEVVELDGAAAVEAVDAGPLGSEMPSGIDGVEKPADGDGRVVEVVGGVVVVVEVGTVVGDSNPSVVVSAVDGVRGTEVAGGADVVVVEGSAVEVVVVEGADVDVGGNSGVVSVGRATVGVVSGTDVAGGADVVVVEGSVAEVVVVEGAVVGVVSGADVAGVVAEATSDKVAEVAEITGVSGTSADAGVGRPTGAEAGTTDVVLGLAATKSLKAEVCASALSAQMAQIAATTSTPARTRRARMRYRKSASCALTLIRPNVVPSSR